MLTTRQAAEKLQVHPETLRQWIREGQLKAIHFGKGQKPRIRIDEADLQAFIDESKTPTEAASHDRERV